MPSVLRNPIYLENPDDYPTEEAWNEALMRLQVAAEMLEFPFFIHADEKAMVFKDFDHFAMFHQGRTTRIGKALIISWGQMASLVKNMPEAIEMAYPWFHDGESCPKNEIWGTPG